MYCEPCSELVRSKCRTLRDSNIKPIFLSALKFSDNNYIVPLINRGNFRIKIMSFLVSRPSIVKQGSILSMICLQVVNLEFPT